MEKIQNLTQYNWFVVVSAIIVAMLAFKFLSELFEWFIKKFGIETKSMREKRENKELLKKTSENLAKLQTRHTKDEEKHCKDEQDFKNVLNTYIKESCADRKALHDEMKQYSQNRIDDRKQSLKIQEELKNSIEKIAQRQDVRDEKIKDLADMLLDKQISDYRWEIINVADKISNGEMVSKECLKHAIATHVKYEEIIEKHNLKNGEVDISIEIINEMYKELLKGSDVK